MKPAVSKRLRVVLDTNVLISALAFQGIVRRVWGLAQEDKFTVFASPFILEELERNLIKLGLSPANISLLIDDVQNTARTIHPTSHTSVIEKDITDNRILECATDAKADVLVTGDIKHIRPLGFFEGIEILTPREFLDKYFPT